MKRLNIKDTFNQELPADPILEHSRRQVTEACFSYATPRVPSSPKLIHASDEMIQEIGLSSGDEHTEEFLKTFSGATVLEGTKPYAMCYGGHQFGNWAGQLGDGRAINLTEVVHNDQRWALQLKGAGETPYSRTADGLAVLRSSVREHLCSEAMYHLGVPTTRSLSLMLTGDEVLRDVMYDGNPAYEKGAVVCRVAPSFVRFGNFQIFASRGDTESLQKLTEYTIRHHFPDITSTGKESYVEFFQQVADRTLDMVIHWQRVGFVHGVMNTDNLSILGLTIDYGPYGWLEGYDFNWTPNTTDSRNRRYQYGNQPSITLWNLAQLGNALVGLIQKTDELQTILEAYKVKYVQRYQSMMRDKLGLQIHKEEDPSLITELERLLHTTETDMTIFFRNLSQVDQDMKVDDGQDFLKSVRPAFYNPQDLTEDFIQPWRLWMTQYINRLQEETTTNAERRAAMDKVNPKYVLRNYMAQLAIDKADEGDFSLVDELYQILKTPYDEQPEYEAKWFVKRPEWARSKVGCSMLSCSS